jgi:hypothetical protein
MQHLELENSGAYISSFDRSASVARTNGDISLLNDSFKSKLNFQDRVRVTYADGSSTSGQVQYGSYGRMKTVKIDGNSAYQSKRSVDDIVQVNVLESNDRSWENFKL